MPEPQMPDSEIYNVNAPGPPAKRVYHYAWINWRVGDWSGNDPYAIYQDEGGLFVMLYLPGTDDSMPDADRSKKTYLTPAKKKPKGKVWAQMWD